MPLHQHFLTSLSPLEQNTKATPPPPTTTTKLLLPYHHKNKNKNNTRVHQQDPLKVIGTTTFQLCHPLMMAKMSSHYQLMMAMTMTMMMQQHPWMLTMRMTRSHHRFMTLRTTSSHCPGMMTTMMTFWQHHPFITMTMK